MIMIIEISTTLFFILITLWGRVSWEALKYPDKNESFERVLIWLREDSFGKAYLNFLGYLMDIIGNVIGDRQQFNQVYSQKKKSFISLLFGFNPFSSQSYEKCILIGFIYPAFLFLFTWMIGGEGRIGDLNWFGIEEDSLENWQKWLYFTLTIFISAMGLFLFKSFEYIKYLFIVFITLGILGTLLGIITESENIRKTILSFYIIFLYFILTIYSGGWLAGRLFYHSTYKAHKTIYNIAFLASFSITIAFAGGNANSGMMVLIGIFLAGIIFAKNVVHVLIIAITIAIMITFAFRGYGIVAFSVISFCSGAIIVIFQFAREKSKSNAITGKIWVFYTIIFISAGAFAISYNNDPASMLWILFWLLLPLVNAPLDWLSLSVTRGLLQSVRSGQHSSLFALTWALLDLILALIFLFLVTAILVGITSLGNTMANKTLVNIDHILKNIELNPTAIDNWWIYFMLLSTLVPTLIHFALAGGAATLWLPAKARHWLADGLERDSHKTMLAWVYITFTPFIGFILVPAGLLYLLYWLINVNSGWLGSHLLDWAQLLAEVANPSPAYP